MGARWRAHTDACMCHQRLACGFQDKLLPRRRSHRLCRRVVHAELLAAVAHFHILYAFPGIATVHGLHHSPTWMPRPIALNRARTTEPPSRGMWQFEPTCLPRPAHCFGNCHTEVDSYSAPCMAPVALSSASELATRSIARRVIKKMHDALQPAQCAVVLSERCPPLKTPHNGHRQIMRMRRHALLTCLLALDLVSLLMSSGLLQRAKRRAILAGRRRGPVSTVLDHPLSNVLAQRAQHSARGGCRWLWRRFK